LCGILRAKSHNRCPLHHVDLFHLAHTHHCHPTSYHLPRYASFHQVYRTSVAFARELMLHRFAEMQQRTVVTKSLAHPAACYPPGYLIRPQRCVVPVFYCIVCVTIAMAPIVFCRQLQAALVLEGGSPKPSSRIPPVPPPYLPSLATHKPFVLSCGDMTAFCICIHAVFVGCAMNSGCSHTSVRARCFTSH
jgi:hypothetical protein